MSWTGTLAITVDLTGHPGLALANTNIPGLSIQRKLSSFEDTHTYRSSLL